jgi:predicted kinase
VEKDVLRIIYNSMKNKFKEPFVLLLIGPPLSGKSTWIKNNFEPDTVTIISRDDLVIEVWGENNYDEAFRNVDQKKVNYLLDSKMKEAAESGDNVIVDMTNMTSKRRRTTLEYFSDDYQKVAVIFPILDWDEYWRRNDKRKSEENKSIPDHVIKNMIASYQPIKKEEGFDKVISI